VDARQKEATPNLPAGSGRTREAWVMWLKPGNEAIYQEKHDHIWPELLSLMKQRGIRNYSIYRHGLMLFAYLEHEGPPTHHELPDPIMLRWWKMMEPYMVCNPDGSPRQEPVEEMFHAD
jgi:L-rhamnose mutarotase